MPEIVVGSQIFDVVFHPTHSIVYTGLLTGHVKAHSIDEQGNSDELFNVRPSKRSCRGLSINSDGSRLYAVGKGASLKYVHPQLPMPRSRQESNVLFFYAPPAICTTCEINYTSNCIVIQMWMWATYLRLHDLFLFTLKAQLIRQQAKLKREQKSMSTHAVVM